MSSLDSSSRDMPGAVTAEVRAVKVFGGHVNLK